MSDDLPLLVGLKALLGRGARYVVIQYDGSGDSGGIESIGGYKELTLRDRIDVPTDLRTEIERWADEISGNNFDNEGSYGEIRIDLKTLEVQHEHSDRVMETEDYARKFVFGDPPKKLRRIKKS